MATIAATGTVAAPRQNALVDHLRRWSPAWLLVAILTFVVLYPLANLFYVSVQAPGGTLTIANFTRVFSQAETGSLIWTTIWMALLRAFIAGVIGIFLAWVVTRTDTPFRDGISFMIWVGYFAPTLPILIAWGLIAGRVGILNAVAQLLPWVKGPVFDVYSYPGIIFVSSLHLSSLVYLLVEPAFRAMDASLEESARMSGASRLGALMKITVPAMAPSILGAMMYSFVLAVESFETEFVFGVPARIYVLSTRIYSLVQEYPQDLPGATALSSFILVLVGSLIVLQVRLLSGRSFVTVTGRGFAARATPLGRWRWLTLALCVLYFICATVLPVAVLVAGSFIRGWGIWSWNNVTMDNWRGFLADPRLTGAIFNTVALGMIVGVVGTAVCAVIAYLVIRTRFPGRHVLEFITWAPRTAPAVVLAVAFAWAFISGTPIFHPILGTIWILAIVLMVNGVPLGSRTITGAMHQVGAELEQAARLCGAGWLSTMRNVIVPLMMPALMSSFVLLFMLAIRNLALVLFFYTPDSRVLSTVLWESWNGRSVERGLVAGVVLMLISTCALLISIAIRRSQRVYDAGAR